MATRLPAPDPDDVLTRATLDAAIRLGIRNNRLADIIGTSEASVSRLSTTRRIGAHTKEGELALLFLRLFRSLDALVGGNDDQARAWLHAHNHHLAGTPAERISTVEGLVDTIHYLDGMRGRL